MVTLKFLDSSSFGIFFILESNTVENTAQNTNTSSGIL